MDQEKNACHAPFTITLIIFPISVERLFTVSSILARLSGETR